MTRLRSVQVLDYLRLRRQGGRGLNIVRFRCVPNCVLQHLYGCAADANLRRTTGCAEHKFQHSIKRFKHPERYFILRTPNNTTECLVVMGACICTITIHAIYN